MRFLQYNITHVRQQKKVKKGIRVFGIGIIIACLGGYPLGAGDQKQPFRYVADSTVQLGNGQTYAALEPYIPFRLGVVQLEGAKHKSGEMEECRPEDGTGEQEHMLFLNCDDGSKFWVVGIEFPSH